MAAPAETQSTEARELMRHKGGAVANDETDLWREYRRAQQERRASRLGPRTDEILALKGKGFDVRALTDYQFRIDGALDLFPIHRRFHDLKTQKRGGYQNALDVAIRRLRTPAATNKERAMQNHEGATEETDKPADQGSTEGSDQPEDKGEQKPTPEGD